MLRTTYQRESARSSVAGSATADPRETSSSRIRRRRDLSCSSARARRKPRAAALPRASSSRRARAAACGPRRFSASSMAATASAVARRAMASSTCARAAALTRSPVLRSSSARVVAASSRPPARKARNSASVRASSFSVPSRPPKRARSSTDVWARRSATASSVMLSSRSPRSGPSMASRTGTSMAAESRSETRVCRAHPGGARAGFQRSQVVPHLAPRLPTPSAASWGQDQAPGLTESYGWDTHNDIFEALRVHLLPRFDWSVSALLEGAGHGLVVCGHRAVGREQDRLLLRRQEGLAQRTLHPLDTHLRSIGDFSHGHLNVSARRATRQSWARSLWPRRSPP